MPALMLQGTGSNVGKSLLVAALCRAATQRGIKTCPFKPQNMSNNAAVTCDGGEIGRAQALQARACKITPHADMNPVLLKPESERGAAVIIQGQYETRMDAKDYLARRYQWMGAVKHSFDNCAAMSDLVIVEGAGSPAEVNLREGDIANMGFAREMNMPVILMGDIAQGGVIAQMVGTKYVLEEKDEALIKGFLINKFKGDKTLFEDGYRLIEQQTGWKGYGILPFWPEARQLPAEDSVALDMSPYKDCTTNAGTQKKLKIACLRLDRIANFDDLDPLALEGQVRLAMIQPDQTVPVDADLILIPGSKSTMADLQKLREYGWDIDIKAHVRRGGAVMGICGGYQMLGQKIYDPDGLEGGAGEMEGLGLLAVNTWMKRDKSLYVREALHADTHTKISGYEIHIGQTSGADSARPFAYIDGKAEGATAMNGQIIGTYLHGSFASDAFRHAFLKRLGGTTMGGAGGGLNYEAVLEGVLDRLAEHAETYLDLDGILELAR